MSNDLEDLLRRTLEDRAATVTSGPRWEHVPVHHRRWIAALAAAAAVAAVAIAAVLIPRGHDAKTPPQTHPPTAVTTTPPPTGGLHGASCSAPLPDAWHSVIAAGLLPTADGHLTPLSMTAAGELLARRTSGGHDQLVVVRPDRSLSIVYTAPAMHISMAAANTRWVMLARTESGGSPYAIEAIDRSTGATITIRSASTRPDAIVQPPVLVQDTVYWTEGDQFGVSDVRAFDLGTRTTRVLDHGYVSGPVSVGGGLFWLRSDTAGSVSGRLITQVPGTLPPGYEVLPWKTYGALVQDGNDYTWGSYVDSGAAYEFHAWTPGADPVTVFPPGQAGAGENPVLAMPYLFARGRVVDLLTGASAALPDTVGFAADGVLAVSVGDRVSIVRAAQLPTPRC